MSPQAVAVVGAEGMTSSLLPWALGSGQPLLVSVLISCIDCVSAYLFAFISLADEGHPTNHYWYAMPGASAQAMRHWQGDDSAFSCMARTRTGVLPQGMPFL